MISASRFQTKFRVKQRGVRNSGFDGIRSRRAFKRETVADFLVTHGRRNREIQERFNLRPAGGIVISFNRDTDRDLEQIRFFS